MSPDFHKMCELDLVFDNILTLSLCLSLLIANELRLEATGSEDLDRLLIITLFEVGLNGYQVNQILVISLFTVFHH